MGTSQTLQNPCVIALLALATACTTTQVNKFGEDSQPISLICIQENERVSVDDILDVLEQGFQRHGIETRLFSGHKPEYCSYVVRYTARRSWFGVPFMRYARLRLYQEDRTVATATYTGRFNSNPWASTKTKLDPLIDELISQP